MSGSVLRAFIERIERIEEEIKTANGDKSEIYKELRGCAHHFNQHSSSSPDAEKTGEDSLLPSSPVAPTGET
ncbi:MAG: GapR family DNA-binding domain-containing protein [Pseudaminobacter sp.]